MKILGIIPARYASTRFPAKILADIKGKTMIRRVYEQVVQAQHLAQIVVATDHEEIAKEVRSFGGQVMMTQATHPSGTDRCQEALQLLEKELLTKFDYVLNIQGDEPFIQPEQIDLLANALIEGRGEVELATMISKASSQEELDNNSEVFVTMNTAWEALYFSRFPIPFQQKVARKDWLQHQTYYKHLGMYAYRTDILGKITQLSPSSLEIAESLEQLRWLQNGYKIKLVLTDMESYCIDTPEDLANLLEKFA
jgi:3-deoxy-manno-octulosonate cytidylyltransferase (CMP-KDO synthetase)